ncbi:EAL domain-containing protein [Denitratimonas sp. CY0512]|uniref:EAL domain-containing protein n=1 Tax=Denitratimonas sp. CY0512 TaxID=3131940 RepID=UPI00309A7E9C
MSRRALHTGETLFREHDSGRSAYLIESGKVRIIVGQDEGATALADLGPGDLVGEMAMIDDAPRTATAVALEDSVLLVIDREHLADRVAQTDPVVRALLGGQLKRYRAMLATLRGLDAPETLTDAEDVAAIAKIRLESQLREALERRELEMHLQPLFEIPQQHVAGYEALIRWRHPERGPISPAEFIALAEETSLIVPVGEYMLHEAIAALVAMRKSGMEPLPFVSINVSPRQLREARLIEQLLVWLKEADLPTSAVKLEITESQVLDYGLVSELLGKCRAHGIRVALDDFGTGFSNLSHLRELAFDTVKIDQAFVRDIETAPRAIAMLEAIVALVQAIGADALVEGIESQTQLDVLQRLGCRYAQGYLIGKPMPLAQVLEGR